MGIVRHAKIKMARSLRDKMARRINARPRYLPLVDGLCQSINRTAGIAKGRKTAHQHALGLTCHDRAGEAPVFLIPQRERATNDRKVIMTVDQSRDERPPPPLNNRGVFRRFQTGADGLIPVSTLGREYFKFDEQRQTLTGDESQALTALDGLIVKRKLPTAARALLFLASTDLVRGRADRAGGA